MDVSRYRAHFPPKEHEEAVRMLLEGLDKELARSDLKQSPKSTSSAAAPKTKQVAKSHPTDVTNTKNTNQIINNHNNNNIPIQSKGKLMKMNQSRRHQPSTKDSSDSFEAASLTTGSSGSCVDAPLPTPRRKDDDDDDDDLLDESRSSSLSQDFIEMSPKERRNKATSRGSQPDRTYVSKMQSKATSTISDSHSTSGAGSLSGSGTGLASTSLLHSAAKHLMVGDNPNDDHLDNDGGNHYEAIPSRTIAVQCDLKASSVKSDGFLVDAATDLASMQASSISSTRYGFYRLTAEAMEERHHHQLARSTSSRQLASSRKHLNQIDSPTSISDQSSVCHTKSMMMVDDNGSYESPSCTRKKLNRRPAEMDSRETRKQQQEEEEEFQPDQWRSLRGRERAANMQSYLAREAAGSTSGLKSRLDSLPRRPKTALSYVSTSRLRDDRSDNGEDDHNYSPSSSSPDRSAGSNHRLMRARAVSHQVLSRARSPVASTATGRGRLPLATYSDSSDTLPTTTTNAEDRYRVPCNEEVLVSSSRRTSNLQGRQQVRADNNEQVAADGGPARLVSSAIGDDDDDDDEELAQVGARGDRFVGRNNEFKRSATISGNSNGFIPSHSMPSNEITNENHHDHQHSHHHQHRRRRRHHHHHHAHDQQQQQQHQDDALNQFTTQDDCASAGVGADAGAGARRASLLNANRITNEPSERRQQPVRYGSMSLSRSGRQDQQQQLTRTLIDRSCNHLNQVGHHKQQRTSTTGVAASSELGPPMAPATLTRATSRQQISKQQQQQQLHRQMPTNNTCCDVDSSPSDLSGSRSRRPAGHGQQQPATICRSTSMRHNPLPADGTNYSTHLRAANLAPFEPAMTNYRRNYHDNDDDDHNDDDDGDRDDASHRQYLARQTGSQFQQHHQMEAASDVVVVESENSDSPMTKTWANPGSSMKPLAGGGQRATHLAAAAAAGSPEVINRRNRRSHSMRDVSSMADMRPRDNVHDDNNHDVQVTRHLLHQHHQQGQQVDQGDHLHHYQAKQFQYNWESASDELSSIENNPHNAQQLFTRAAAAHQHQQLDYDSQHRLNESGLPETNSLVSSSSSSSSAAAAAAAATGAPMNAPKFYRNAPASCLGLPSSASSSSAAVASGRQTLNRQQQQHQLTSSASNNNLNGARTNNGYATTGRQQSGLVNGNKQQPLSAATITGRAMSQQSLVRPSMPLSSGRRLRRQNNNNNHHHSHGSGGSSGGGSELGGSSLSLMSSRFLAGSRYENAHTRSPVVMYIPQANSKPSSMSDLNAGGRSTATGSRRSSRSRLAKGASSHWSSQDNMATRRKSSLSRHASDNESQSSMLRTLIRPKGSRSSGGHNGAPPYGSKRSSKLGRRRAGDHSNGEDEDMDGVGQLASEIDSYKFRRRYSVPKDAKINWFAKLRQRVISSK